MKRSKKQTKSASTKKKVSRTQTPKTDSADAERQRDKDQFGVPGSNYGEPPAKVRFEATIHAAGPGAMSIALLDRLDIDRVPDPKGEVRALVTADECVRLLEKGFEVRLQHAHPVRPLNRALIETDESVRRWIDERVRNIKRPQ